jgi:hypothetical protein
MGIEGILVRNYVTSRRPSVERRTAAMLRSYTGIFLNQISDLQMSKSKLAITTPGPQPVLYNKQEVKEKFLDKGLVFTPGAITLDLGRFENSKPEPGEITVQPLGVLSGTSHYPSGIHLSKSAMMMTIRKKKVDKKGSIYETKTEIKRPYLDLMLSLMTKGSVPESLIEELGDFSIRQHAQNVQDEHLDETLGSISVIQEGGAKARVVCSPNAWIQYYCYPYHKYMARVITSIESDESTYGGRSCMIDQVKGAFTVIRQMEQGKDCYCVDLSSATDRFPLSVQQKVCCQLGIPEFAEALNDLKGPYKGLDGSEWTYAQGQPMGLYGSFPLFHITHFALLNGLTKRLGLSGSDNFCVLGDDVVIFDKDLRDAYYNALASMGVATSEAKCYTGNLLEFAGFIISRKENGKINAFRPYKYKRDFEFSSVMNVIHAFGQNVTDWSKSWERSYDLYSKTEGLRSLDLSPLVPQDSMGFSERKSIDSWLPNLLAIISEDPKSCSLDPEGFMVCWEEDFENMLYERDSNRNVSDEEAKTIQGFEPSLYVQQEFDRKKFFSNFWRDNTIRVVNLEDESSS